MAALFKACVVRGCNGNANSYAKGARGYCSAHYQRLRKYGDPLGGGTGHGEPRAWLEERVGYTELACLVWPFTRNVDGYAVLSDGPRGQTGAHREMCRLAHGEPPTSRHQAAHSCGNGGGGCVNPRHLRWDTSAGNQADKVLHGTSNRGERHPKHRLTEDDVRFIRRFASSESIRSMAKRYGVSRPSIKAVITGRNWGWLD